MASNIFLSASWENLIMFNYEVDPEILKPYLPPYTELDLYNNKAIVSVVGFMFNNTKVLGIKWPGFINFEEVNLRYYVKYFDGKEWKRGAAFISEIVPKFLVSSIANFWYNEHYSVAKMNHAITHNAQELKVSYNWKKKNQDFNTMWIKASALPKDIEPNSEEEFIFEHYYGYNKLNETTTIEYSLAHPRWQVFPVTDYKLDYNVEQLYGAAFVPFLQDIKPRSVYMAKGSNVSVKFPVKIYTLPEISPYLSPAT